MATKETKSWFKTDNYDHEIKKGYTEWPSGQGDKAKAITTPCGCEQLWFEPGPWPSLWPVDDAELSGPAEVLFKQDGCNTTTASVLYWKKLGVCEYVIEGQRR